VRDRVNAAADLWLRRFHAASPDGGRVVCLPHAGGAATFYRALSEPLAPDVETLCVQYPGRQDRHREPAVGDLHRLADLVADVLIGLDDRPTVLFGHSMGATVGFEVARRMEAAGRTPEALVASGRRAPGRYRPERVHLGGDQALVADMIELDGTDVRVLRDEELLGLALPALRGDYRAIETYRCADEAEPLTIPVTVLIGDSDPRVTPEEAHAWADHTSAGTEVRTFRGGHFSLTSYWPEIAAVVRSSLRKAAESRA
jgi:surfactin synthase thioesterase subunit